MLDNQEIYPILPKAKGVLATKVKNSFTKLLSKGLDKIKIPKENNQYLHQEMIKGLNLRT